VETVFRKA